MIVVKRDADLPEMIHALQALRGAASALDRGEQ
jgi:hypothetical protein